MYTGEAEAKNMRQVGFIDLDGCRDGMQIMASGDAMYVGHISTGVGTSIVDVSDPTKPRLVKQLMTPEHTRCHKVQTAGDIMMVNYEAYPMRTPARCEKAGIQLYDISDRFNPKELGYFETGGRGVHRIWYTGGDYANISAEIEGYTNRIWMLLDVSDPMKPIEVSRWWMPGMWTAGGEEPTWQEGLRPGAHHGIVWEDRVYLSFWDGGFYILCTAHPEKLKEIAHMSWVPEDGGKTHTTMPLPERNLLIVADEATSDHCQEVLKHVRVIDISDERNPCVISKFPVPEGDFCERGLRFGPHNLHENRPEAFQSDEMIFVTYFNTGIRVLDIRDPGRPEEIAFYIPERPKGQMVPQTNSIFVDESRLIYISDRVSGRVDILELTI